MPYQITCEGIVAADFHNEEKAYDYVQYALSKPDCNTVTITLTDDNGQPMQAEQQQVQQPQADPNVATGTVTLPDGTVQQV